VFWIWDFLGFLFWFVECCGSSDLGDNLSLYVIILFWWIVGIWRKFEPLCDSIAIFKVCDYGFSFEFCLPLLVILVMNCGNLEKVWAFEWFNCNLHSVCFWVFFWIVFAPFSDFGDELLEFVESLSIWVILLPFAKCVLLGFLWNFVCPLFTSSRWLCLQGFWNECLQQCQYVNKKDSFDFIF
jgi:hypothetical protein